MLPYNPALFGRLGFTSGRRTYAGNRAVGGVPNSAHLYGNAADFTAPMSEVQAAFPGMRVLDEGDHRHVSGFGGTVPYHGNKGVTGLVNGVDTSAPKGKSMLSPKKPTAPPFPDFRHGWEGPKGTPPIIPQETPFAFDSPALGGGAPDLAALTQNIPQIKKGGVLGSGLGWGDVLANGLVGFAAGMGNSGPLESLQRANAQRFENDQFRERLAAQIQMQREKMLEPPQFVQDAAAFSRLSPEQKQQVIGFRDAMYPVLGTYVDEQGNERQGVYSRSQGDFVGRGGNTQTIDGVTYYNINGKWYDNPEGR